MAYNYITNYDSPNYTPSASSRAVFGYDRVIEGITIHWWGDPAQNPQFQSIVNYLCRANGNTSAHYVASGTNRQVACIVSPQNVAWHSGSAWGNARTIGIECDPRARDEDYDVVAELIADIRSAYGDVPLYWHSYFTSTSCPGVYDVDRLDKLSYTKFSHATEWGKGGNKAPSKAQATEEEVKQAYRDILEREADAGGLKTYLDADMSIAEVRTALQASQEYKDLQIRKAAEAAAKEKDKTLYKLSVNGKQVSAYSTDKNAYDGWVQYGKTGTIVQNSVDVTKTVVDKYTAPSPTTQEPDGTTQPDSGKPVTEKDGYTEDDRKRDNALYTLVQQIFALLKSVWGSLTSLHKKVK